MRQKSHKAGDLVYAPQASLLHTGANNYKTRMSRPCLIVAPDPTEDSVGWVRGDAVYLWYLSGGNVW